MAAWVGPADYASPQSEPMSIAGRKVGRRLKDVTIAMGLRELGIGENSLQPRVLFLKLLETLRLVDFQATELLLRVKSLLRDTDLLDRYSNGLASATSTSTSRSLGMIW